MIAAVGRGRILSDNPLQELPPNLFQDVPILYTLCVSGFQAWKTERESEGVHLVVRLVVYVQSVSNFVIATPHRLPYSFLCVGNAVAYGRYLERNQLQVLNPDTFKHLDSLNTLCVVAAHAFMEYSHPSLNTFE